MVSQEWLALKPDWHLYSKSLLVRKAMKCLHTCFSRIFEMTGRSDIGRSVIVKIGFTPLFVNRSDTSQFELSWADAVN